MKILKISGLIGEKDRCSIKTAGWFCWV